MSEIITAMLKEQYGLAVRKTEHLSGYATKNTLVTCKKSHYVLKEYAVKEIPVAILEEESRVLCMLAEKYPLNFPLPIPNNSGTFTTPLKPGSGKKVFRLLNFIEGDFFTNQTHSTQLIESFGILLAKMDLELLKMKSMPIETRISDWDLQHLNTFANRSQYIKDPQIKKEVDYFALQFRQEALPVLPHLRKSLIHGDANDGNVLVVQDQVNGIIDFGDMCHTPLINELAIALTYVMFYKEDPLEAGTKMVAAYNQILTLEEKEISLLYYLVGARLCLSLWNSSYYRRQNDNDHILMSEKGAKQLLTKWIAINPKHATQSFLRAAGYAQKQGHNLADTLALRKKHISKSLSISYEEPIHMERAAFQYMFDNKGKTYLDMCNNIPHVGHCHPLVVIAGQKQMAKLNTNTRYLYDSLQEYSDRLLKKFPAELNKIFFVNSGSAANDLAIRLARTHTGHHDLMIVEHGYHGNTATGIEISSYKFDRKGGGGKATHILKAPMPDLLRGKYTKEKNAGEKYANDAIQMVRKHPNTLAAFIAEPIIGCGGQIPLPPKYLSKIYEKIREQGGVCISDEVQTGFGRLGEVFWGFEQHEVIPDIVVLGKPMGNGHPIGAVITTDTISSSFETGMEYFSSFGGNPVSCEIGMAVLDIIEKENLQQHALQTGNYLRDKLLDLSKTYQEIGEIRGAGLFLGIELICNAKTLEPATTLAKQIKEDLKSNGILVGTDGPYDNVIKIKPPLCFDKSNADQFMKTLSETMKNRCL